MQLHRRMCLPAFAGLYLIASTVHAQVDSGAILGQVSDPSGAPIPGAILTLVSEDTGLTSTMPTDSRGAYSFSPVRIGSYTLTVERQGFSKITQHHLKVNIQQEALVNFSLQIGQVDQTITVADVVPVLQTQDASVGQVIDARPIRDLPLNGRNYTFLAQLAAGVTFGQKDTRGEDSNGRFSANGTRPTQNNYLLDGIDNNSSINSRQNGKDFVVLTPVDGLAEFKVQTNNYNAQFGRAAGAVLNATVKSGTNQLHGDAWEFLRNDKVDATDFFINAAGKPISEFRRNQFGFTQGGPVYLPHLYDGRNRTFFFVDYEGTRIRQGVTDVSTVPTLSEKQSGYTNFQDLIANQSGKRTDASGASYASGTIFDPATTRALGNSFIRDPFPSNMIPSSRLDPNAVKILQLLPNPTSPGILANYISSPIFQDNSNSYDIRIDEIVSDHDQLFGRFTSSRLNRLHPGPFPGLADGGDSLVNSNLEDNALNAIVAETHGFTPSMINEFRLGLNRESAIWLQPNGDQMGIPAQFGIQGVPQTPGNGGLPEFTVGSYSRFGSYGFMPSEKFGTTPQITDDFTWNRHSHTIKGGFTGQRIWSPFTQPPQARGLLNFSGAYTSVVNQTDNTTAVAQMLLAPVGANGLGGATQVQLSNFHSHDLRRFYSGAYVQDDWKLTPKLTLNLGLRWDYFSFMEDKFGDNANLIPGPGMSGGIFLIPDTRANLLPSTFTSALNKDGIRVMSNGLHVGSPQKTNFGPRFGFAWQATSKLVVRGGYGIFYGGTEEIGGNPLLTENFPFEYTVTRTALTSTSPIIAGNSIGLIENSFQNLSLDPATVSVSGLPLKGFQYNWKTPSTQSRNLMLEYQVGRSSSVSVGYVGSGARHIPEILNANPVLTILPPGTNSLPYIPYPDFATSGGNYTTTQGSSNYNSLQTSFERRFSAGLSVLANFTWSKVRTDGRDPLEGDIGGYRAPFLPGFGIQKDTGFADFDVRRSFHFSGLYELPFGKGKRFAGNANRFADHLIGGWSLNWIVTAQDGQPFTVTCPLATTTGSGCDAFLVPGQDRYAGTHDVNHFLNAAAFSNPPAATHIGQTDYTPLGGAPTQVSGPPFRRLDLSLFKRIPVSDRISFEFRAEAFNVTNTPNFANPSLLNFLDTTSFGRVTATRDSPNDPRELQFGLKFYW